VTKTNFIEMSTFWNELGCTLSNTIIYKATRARERNRKRTKLLWLV